jgi:hypothetical protein
LGPRIGLGQAGRAAGSDALINGCDSGARAGRLAALVELVDRADEISEPLLRSVRLDYLIDDDGTGVRVNNNVELSILR